jgi:hypothetical protein
VKTLTSILNTACGIVLFRIQISGRLAKLTVMEEVDTMSYDISIENAQLATYVQAHNLNGLPSKVHAGTRSRACGGENKFSRRHWHRDQTRRTRIAQEVSVKTLGEIHTCIRISAAVFKPDCTFVHDSFMFN